MDEDMDAVIVVRCDPQQQLTRCQEKFGIDQKEAKLRIKAQKPLNSKIDKADFVIDTAGSKSETFVQVRRIYSTLIK
jgi:dephospho-CoA kinase